MYLRVIGRRMRRVTMTRRRSRIAAGALFAFASAGITVLAWPASHGWQGPTWRVVATVIFGTEVARRALTYLTTPRSYEPAFPELTPREREALGLVADGMSIPAIATRLGLAMNTVSNHISNIFAKLQVASRAEAIVRARTTGLGH
jgi:DNA-binding CsgD family transcriptional regulator